MGHARRDHPATRIEVVSDALWQGTSDGRAERLHLRAPPTIGLAAAGGPFGALLHRRGVGFVELLNAASAMRWPGEYPLTQQRIRSGLRHPRRRAPMPLGNAITERALVRMALVIRAGSCGWWCISNGSVLMRGKLRLADALRLSRAISRAPAGPRHR